MKTLRRHKQIINLFLVTLMAIWQIGQPLQAAANIWTANTTTNFNWSDGTNWSLGVPTAADLAVFGTPIPNPGALANPQIIALSGGSLASALSLKDNYTLTGGDLTLTTGGIRTDLGMTTTLASQLIGAGGLTVTGGGTLRLTNALNSYTGTTTISNGAVVINNGAALGADPSVIVVSGSATRGFGGGSLLLEGNSGAGVTLTRDLSLQGLGPITDRGVALFSVQNNTISGNVQTGVGLVNTNIHSAGGRLTFSGGLNIGGTSGTTFTTFGGVNSAGVGSYAITGTLTGTGSIQKTSSGTLILNPSDATGFSGTTRITAGTVRLTTATAFGANAGTTTNSTIDMNGGLLEILSDSSLNIGKGIYHRANGATLFADHAVGGTAINNTVTFGALAFEENLTTTFASRNGYNITIAATPVQGGTNNSNFTNNLAGGGLLTFNGAFWSEADTTSRTMTIAGNGNTLISGNVTASSTTAAVDHALTKTGTGTLTISSTTGTLDGALNVNGGTVAIADFRSINNSNANTGTAANFAVNIGTGATAGTLQIGVTGVTPTAGGLSTARIINLAGTTGGGTINASQTGGSPVVIANFGNTGAGAKTLTLGGTSTVDNVINGVIADNAANILTFVKTDPGTWVLGGNNTYTGTTTISGGTLKLKASAAASNIIASTAAITFNANATTQTAGGTLEFVGQASTTNSESLGALTPTAGMNTIKLTPVAGGTASLTFTSLGTVNAASGTNIVTPNPATSILTITGQAASTATTLPGTGKIYINGADFARTNASAQMVVPSYGTDAGFVVAGAALTATSHNRLDATIASQAAATVSSLKVNGNPSLGMTGLLTISTGGLLQTGGTTGVLSGTGVTTGGTNSLAVRVNLSTDVYEISAPITNTTTGGLTKNGAGTLILSSAANAQTGATTINEGTLRLTAAAVLSVTAQDLSIRQGATLDLNGNSTGAAIKNLVGAGTITNGNASTVTLTVGNGTPAASTFSGIIQNGSGTVGLLKRGTAALTLTGLSTYTGSTTIESTGSLTVTNLADIGSASGIGRGDSTSTATNAASLVFSGPGTGPTPSLIYTGTNSVSTNRLLTLDMLTAGSVAVISNNSGSNGALVFSNTSPIAFGLNATGVAQTLSLAGSSTGDSVFTPQITDNGATVTNVTKAGAGQWVLGAVNNAYTGNTSITQGILIAKDGTSLPNNSGLLLGSTTTSGVLQTSGDFTRNVAAAAAANSVTWSGTTGGGGFAAADNKLVVAMGGIALPTALTWGSGGFVGTGGVQALILNSTTAMNEVEWRNPIDLGALPRTIQVDDNGNTQTDFATITGVLSGAAGGGVSKTGTGTLQLFGANTHVGTTAVTAGTLVVNSLGLSTGPVTGTSVGSSAGANTAAQAVTLGNGTTTVGILQYVGPGETSDRMIRLNTTTGSNQIHADGSGALVLTNVLNDMVGGAKTLILRGSNTAGNMITSNLADNGGTLGVTVDGGATWILSGANTYTGTTSANAGALGIGSAGALSTSTLSLSNSSVFAYGADRTVGNALTHANNTTQAFIGDYSLNFTGVYTNASAANNNAITNNIVTGKTLSLGAINNNAITAARTLTFNGSGDTIINGDITTSTAFGLGLTYSGTGSLRLNGTASDWNAGVVTISSGKLIIGASEVIPHGVSTTDTGNVVLSPAASITATLDLNGQTETVNGLTGTSAGTMIIDNSSPLASSLIVGANDQVTQFNGSITRSGGGDLVLGKTGTAIATFAGPADVTGFNVQSGALKMTGGITNPLLVTSVVVAGGGLLQLFDTVGAPLPNLNTLNLGAGAGIATLEFEAGTTTDTLTTSAAAIVANTVNFNIRDAGLTAGNSYPLLVAPSGLTGTYTLGPIGGYTGSTLTISDTLVQLNVGTAVVGNMFWTGIGTTALAWNSVDGLSNGDNWSSDKPGAVVSTTVPGAGTSVIFQSNAAASAPAGAFLATTLEQSFRINNLVVETSTNPQPSISIAPGAIATNRLTIQPAVATDGINIQTGTAKGMTISSQFAAGAAQTWTVADLTTVPLTGGGTTIGTTNVVVAGTAGLVPGMQIVGPGIPTGAIITAVVDANNFTISANATQTGSGQAYTATSSLNFTGGLFGSGNITKAGSGRTVLAGAGNTYTGTAVNVTGGILELQNVTALGGVAATPGTGATVTIGSGTQFRYNNSTAGTVVNPLVLNGGTLTTGGFTTAATTLALTAINHTFSGPVNVAADSTIHLADLANHATAVHTITMPGVFTGTGKITLDGVSVASGGNQLNGNLVINGANAGWSGGLLFNRGTVTTNNVDGIGTGGVTFNFGRLNFQGINGATYNLANPITHNTGAIGEIGVDNTSTPTSPFTLNFSGALNLGAGAGMRIFLTDGPNSVANFSGPVTMNGDASISVGGTTAGGVATVSSVISEVGGARALAVNDDLGGWGTTNRTLRLTGLNTFTGNVTLGEGILEFDTVTNAGGAASSLGQGTAVTMGAATLSFIGGVSQSTDRPITQVNAAAPTTALTSTLSANGTGGATMTYTGAITGGIHSFALDGTGVGNLNGVLTQGGNATADVTKAGTGTWNLNATNVVSDDFLINLGTLNVNVTQQAADDFVVTGGATPTIVNLNAANSHQGDDFFIRSGAVVNVGINGAFSNNATNGMDALNIGDTGTNGATLDLKGFTGNTVNAATIGVENTIDGFIIDSVGGGNISSTGWVMRNGAASATLAGATLAKNGSGTFTLSGNNTYTGAATVTEGQLILDYTTNNGSKIAAAGVTIGGAAADANPTLTLNGNATFPTTQAFTVLTVSPGSGNIVVNSNGGQAANLNFTTITRTVGGTIDFTLPTVGNITSTQALTNGILGGYSTLNNGASFVSKDGTNNLIAPTLAAKDDVLTWLSTDNVTDTTGYTNSLVDCVSVNSVTFTAAGSTVNATGRFGINTGGVLVKSTSTGAGISGGSIVSSSNDLIVHQYAAGDFTVSSSIRGINGVTKTGTGALVLSGNNTSTGTVTITEGLFKVSGGNAIGDASPVNLKDVAGSGLQLLANETIGNLAGGGAVGGNIALGSNTLTVNQSTNLLVSSQITGSGTLVKQGTANLNFDTSISTAFTGSVVINQGLLFLSGNGVANMPLVSSITSNSGGAFLLDFNSGTTGSSRINDGAPINLSSYGNGAFAGLQIRSNQDVSHSESYGALNLQGGSLLVGVAQAGGTARTLTLTASSLTRLNNATVFLGGRNLAVTTGDNRGRILFTAAPTNVGGTGVAGAVVPATNVPILRFAVTQANTAAFSVNDIPNTFANYNTTTGVTPLLIATEYRLDSAGYTASADANDNLRITTGATGLVNKTFNAAVFDASTAAMTVSGAGAGNILTINSGAMLFTSNLLANGTTLDGFDSIAPGAGSGNEWIITTANTTATINSILADGAGATTLTKSGTGTLVLGAPNSYTGPTVLNQGIVRATNDANLGVGGGLNFFGGTLQFGGVFDPSTRVITFNSTGGGATFDTDVNNIVIANPIGNAGTGSLTKTGTGSLTISAPTTHTGGLIVTNGSLIAGVANMQPVGRNITVNGATAILDVGAFYQTVGTLNLVTGAVNGTATITASDYQLQAGTVSSTVVLAGNTVTKTTTGVATLSGANTFTGQVAVQAGTLSFDSIANADGTPSALGAPTTPAAAAILMGLGTNATALTYTGAGHSSNREVDLVGTTGATTINANGTGAVSVGAITSEEYGAKSLVLNGTSAGGIINKITAPITECFGVLTLQKLGTNTWELDAVSTYTGATQVDDGILMLGITNALPVTTAVRLGNTTTAGTLDLNGFDQTIGSLTSSTNSAIVTNNIFVDAGNTLTINGAVTLGANVDASTTLVTASGAGSMVVNSAGANFQVGGATGGTNENTATVDFSGLSSFTANLGAGTFRIGDANTASGTAAPATMKLAVTSAITAASIRVGDGSGFGNIHTLTLGSGINTLNADTLNVGSAGANIRSSGTVNFDAGDTTGSVQVRASNGTGRATINMVNTTGNTAADIDSTVNLAGHTANILASTLTMATRTTGTGVATAALTFDQGTLDITTLTMASRTGVGTGAATATVTLGDSAALGAPNTTIGRINMAVNTSAGGTVTADLNVTGGTVDIGDGLNTGTAINMANAAASRTVNSTIDLTGGTVNVTGDIVRTGGAGTENATITLDASILNMNGNSIGETGKTISLAAKSGTLTGLAELNGGGVLDKTTVGVLIMGDGNSYTGNTTVTGGTLWVNNTTGSGTGTGTVTSAATTTLGGTGTIAPSTGNGVTTNGTLQIGGASPTVGEDLHITLTSATLAINEKVAFDIFGGKGSGVANSASDADRLLLTGSTSGIVALGAGASLVVNTAANTGWTDGSAWQLFEWASIVPTGTFSNLTSTQGNFTDLPDLSSFNLAWDVSNIYTAGTISIVPEPSRLMLLMFGLLGLFFRRRRND